MWGHLFRLLYMQCIMNFFFKDPAPPTPPPKNPRVIFFLQFSGTHNIFSGGGRAGGLGCFNWAGVGEPVGGHLSRRLYMQCIMNICCNDPAPQESTCRISSLAVQFAVHNGAKVTVPLLQDSG